MRKRIGGKQLNRDTSARKALFKGLVVSLVRKESIETTKAKAAALRPIVEKMITTARSGSVQARRQIQSVVQDAVTVKKLVDTIAPRFKDVRGGYTRIIRVGTRRGDNAEMVRLSFTKLAAPTVKAGGAEKVAPQSAEKSPEVKTAAKLAPAAPKVSKPKATVKKATKPTIGVRRGER